MKKTSLDVYFKRIWWAILLFFKIWHLFYLKLYKTYLVIFGYLIGKM